jgi:hypothetical protein
MIAETSLDEAEAMVGKNDQPQVVAKQFAYRLPTRQ